MMIAKKVFLCHQILVCKRSFSTKIPFSLNSISAPISFRTCSDVYGDLLHSSRNSHFYEKAPVNGFDLCVAYADSALTSPLTSFDRTVVAVHGVYGYFNHFEKLFRHFHGSRVRVIAPNMPDFSHTVKHGFWHSPTERGAFLKDFLLKVGVTKVDCLVSHSSGMVPAAEIWGKVCYFVKVNLLLETLHFVHLHYQPGPIKVNSVVLFSPQSGWIEYNPRLDYCAKCLTIRHPLWYRFLELIRIHKLPYWPVFFGNINEFLSTAAVFLHTDSLDELYYRVEYFVKETSTPISILMGAKDFLIFPKSNEEVHQRLGIAMKEVLVVDTKVDNLQDKLRKTGRRMNSYSIKSGGHFVHQRHANYANRIIENMLDL